MSISDVVFEAAVKSGVSLEHLDKEEPILKIRSVKESDGWDIILYYPGKITKTVKLLSSNVAGSDASKFIEHVFGDVQFAKEAVRNAEGIVIK
ncbi:hypothetical protein FDI90_gp091 [Pseudomonas phage PA7]|uniref:Uncharacterized protein n=1 Tax=Pseudomonas phage PA7 TaxID=347330 RepID=I7DNI4_9CAUD|nr:hypothetical protein FDI90_gp091 [Pseudomonas phage PA7]AFO70898.1 hypothetical protein [Pseudomonas phage PA7]